jgi:hypothetical protein
VNPNQPVASSGSKQFTVVEQLRANPKAPRLSEAEWAALERHLAPVVEGASKWCERLPIVNMEAVVPVSIVSIVALSNINDTEPILVRAKSSLWIYALDDAIDDLSQADATIEELVNDCRATITDIDHVGVKCELTSILRSLMQEFAAFPNFYAFFPLWQKSLMLIIDGMLYERWLCRRAKADPSDPCLRDFEAYLAHGIHTVALSHLLVGALFMDPDPRNISCLEDLWQIAQPCSLAMRLANDLAGFAREQASGEVNAVSILAHRLMEERDPRSVGDQPPSTMNGIAIRGIRLRIQKELQLALDLVTALGSPAGSEWRIYRATECGVEIYLSQDFREWDQEAVGHEYLGGAS